MELPATVQEIADVIGREWALYLIGQLPRFTVMDRPGYGGKHRGGVHSERVILYVPKRLKPDHRLVQILGEDRARALSEWFGGETLQVANCNGVYTRFRDAEVRRLANDNWTPAQLAELMGVSARHVRGIVGSAANDNGEIPQGD